MGIGKPKLPLILFNITVQKDVRHHYELLNQIHFLRNCFRVLLTFKLSKGELKHCVFKDINVVFKVLKFVYELLSFCCMLRDMYHSSAFKSVKDHALSSLRF